MLSDSFNCSHLSMFRVFNKGEYVLIMEYQNKTIITRIYRVVRIKKSLYSNFQNEICGIHYDTLRSMIIILTIALSKG